MKRELSLEESRSLCGLIRKSFEFLENLRQRDDLAKFIQYPKIPPRLSESIALHFLRRGEILSRLRNYKFQLGSQRGAPDIEGRFKRKSLRIEIKATAVSAFQELKKGDIASDYLIWLHFGNYFVSNESSIHCYCLPRPNHIIRAPAKITLRNFIKIGKGSIQKAELNL